MSDHRQNTNLSPRQVTAGLLSVGAILAFISVATLFRDNSVVRSYLIGPHGLMAALWLLLLFAVLSYLSSRERNRSKASRVTDNADPPEGG
jgi:hypothetical protein